MQRYDKNLKQKQKIRMTIRHFPNRNTSGSAHCGGPKAADCTLGAAEGVFAVCRSGVLTITCLCGCVVFHESLLCSHLGDSRGASASDCLSDCYALTAVFAAQNCRFSRKKSRFFSSKAPLSIVESGTLGVANLPLLAIKSGTFAHGKWCFGGPDLSVCHVEMAKRG